MAANSVRRTLQFSSASAKTILNRSLSPLTASPSSAFTKLSGLGIPCKPTSSSASRSCLHRLSFSRLPVELGGALSLMPLHSVTASALYTNLLSLTNAKWGALSEGFASTL